MAKKPIYEVTDADIKKIISLYKKCIEIDLGNVSFKYFNKGLETTFYLTEYKSYWELVIVDELQYKVSCSRDIYKVIDDKLIYQFSEQD